METLRGAVSHCQHTLKVSGGGNNTSTTTTYITLFRVNGRAMELRSGRPTSLSDGDQMAVAGLPSGSTLTVLALRNLNTGEMMNAGIYSYFFGAALLAAIGIFLCVYVVSNFGGLITAGVAGVILLLVAHFVYRGILTIRADNLVRS